jgi:hypothetical protein
MPNSPQSQTESETPRAESRPREIVSTFRSRLTSAIAARTPPPPPDIPSPVALSSVRNAYLRNLLPSLRCPICIRGYNESHQAHVLVPCGHSVCEASIERLQRCPICRAPIENTVPNRELMTVLGVAKKTLTPPSGNTFLDYLRKHRRTLEGIQTKRETWSSQQVEAVNDLIIGMKRHADDVDDDWIDATGLNSNVTNFLHRKLTILNRILRHRARLGWKSSGDLPMVL